MGCGRGAGAGCWQEGDDDARRICTIIPHELECVEEEEEEQITRRREWQHKHEQLQEEEDTRTRQVDLT
jgi:hypothetical protein